MARTLTGEGIAPMPKRMCRRALLCREVRARLRLRSQQQAALRLGGSQGDAGVSKLPLDQRTPLIERAIEQGVDFLFSVDPATAAYPCGWAPKPSGNWWKFGFPVFYITDLLQIAEALVELGYGERPAPGEHCSQLIEQKQDAQGRWPLEFEYKGKTWVEYGEKKQANKWVTYRAVKVLSH